MMSLDDVLKFRFTRNDVFMYLGLVCGACFARSLESLDDRNLCYVLALVSSILVLSPDGNFPVFDIPLDFHFYEVSEKNFVDNLPF